MPFVIDTSVALSWCYADEESPLTRQLLRDLEHDEAHVPTIWLSEIANAVLVGERRGRLTSAAAAQFMSLLGALPINVDDSVDLSAIDALTVVGRIHGLTAYDAAFLELAMRLGVPLAALDNRLRNAATAAGVELLLATEQ